MSGRIWLVLKVAATYMGTVVGAGFASGQETLRFFAAHGRGGLWGLGIATLLLAGYGALALDLGRRLQARSHRELLDYACGPRLGRLMDVVVTLFLFVGQMVMLAGAGAVVAEQFRLPMAAGVWLTVAVTFVTVLGRLRGIVAANAVVVPVLVVLVCGLSLVSLRHHGWDVQVPAPDPGLAVGPHWLASAWLYVAYNLVLSLAVLGPLGAAVDDRRVLLLGGALGGAGLGVLALAIGLTVAAHQPQVDGWQVPMLYIARLYPPVVQVGFALVLWAEIYTTAISAAYGFAQRAAAATGIAYPAVVFAAMSLAVLGSRLGFANLVGTLYPAFGWASLGVLVLLLWRLVAEPAA